MVKKTTTKKKTTKKKKGAPSKLTEETRQHLINAAIFGHTDEELAYIVGVTYQTINNWKRQDPDLFESLKNAKIQADAKVTQSLYARATGQIIVTEKHEGVDANGNIVDKTVTKEVAPDTTSIIFWLKNRQPDKWRDKRDIEHSEKPKSIEELIREKENADQGN